jgi:hypothetical protein
MDKSERVLVLEEIDIGDLFISPWMDDGMRASQCTKMLMLYIIFLNFSLPHYYNKTLGSSGVGSLVANYRVTSNLIKRA